MTNIINTSPATFQQDVLNNDGLVLVDFYAQWCGPCKALGPILNSLAEQNPNLKIVKVDADEAQDLMSQYGVRGIPTLLLFKSGQVIATKVGAEPLPQLTQFINQTD